MANDLPLLQAGCLPYRDQGGEIEVLLVTSRATGAWIAPKGSIEPGESAKHAALREAAEEAGVYGRSVGLLGTFSYPRGQRRAQVETFLLEVDQILSCWPEMGQRRRRWFTLAQALVEVDRPEVLQMLNALSTHLQR